MPDIPNLYAYNNFALEFNGKHPNKLSKMKYMFCFFLFLKIYKCIAIHILW